MTVSTGLFFQQFFQADRSVPKYPESDDRYMKSVPETLYTLAEYQFEAGQNLAPI